MRRYQYVAAAIVVALIAVCLFSIYQLACYVSGRCPGTRATYVTYAALALTSLYFLAVVHVFLHKARIR